MQLFNFDISLPLKDPVLIFAIVLFIILLAPIILKKFKIPGIVGLIISGMIFGPHGLNLLARDSSIVLFGTVGLLYIMFLAGLDLDMNDFKKNKNKSIVFGALTFFIPLIIGLFVCIYLLHFSLVASILIASMFSTHTLVSYPIVSRLGIVHNEAVATTVGGTIITDTTVLLLLAIISASTKGTLNTFFWLKLVISLAIFVFIVFWVFPKIARWFFKNIEGESKLQFIFVLALLFTAGFLSELAGVEPIIGAFLAGLSLNRLIPKNSYLIDKLDFVGNAIFIPFFLISVGMIVNIGILSHGTQALVVAATLTFFALITKWLAAYFTQKIFKYSINQRNLIFGLSSSHAAATLAMILIGFNLGIINEQVLNGTIILILITCLVSSFVTENAGRQQAIDDSGKKKEEVQLPQRIVVPIANPKNIERLIEFGLMIKDHKLDEMLYPLTIVHDEADLNDRVMTCRGIINNAAKEIAPHFANKIQVVSRIDINTSSGIIRAVKELLITDVVIGLNMKSSISELLFGSLIDNLLEGTNKTIYLIRDLYPLNTIETIYIALPENAELEVGFERFIITSVRLAINSGSNVVYCGFISTLNIIKLIYRQHKIAVTPLYETIKDINELLELSKNVRSDDMIIMINSRPKSVSHDIKYEQILDNIANKFPDINLAIVYPEQNLVLSGESFTKYDIMDSSPIQENIVRISELAKIIKHKFIDKIKSKRS